MMSFFFYAAFSILLASCLIAFWIEHRERRITLSLLQVLFALPLLAGLYAYFATHAFPGNIVGLVIFSEAVFAVVWFGLSYRLGRVPSSADHGKHLPTMIQGAFGIILLSSLFYTRIWDPSVYPVDPGLAIIPYDRAYFCAFFLLIVMLFAAWQFEVFWRTLEPARRWEYKFLVVGAFTVCGAFGWAASYRLTYGLLKTDHFLLLFGLLLVAWAFMGYAVARHKLLNRKIFISRKVVYTFVAPTLFAVYLLLLGLVSLLMRIYGLSMPFVLYWLAIALGLMAVGLFIFSGKLRRRVKFFISTHFYVNKYEYRDEWLALSARLQGAESESDVIAALQQVMAGSLYASNIVIWVGDREHGYKVFSAQPPLDPSKKNQPPGYSVGPHDPLVDFFSRHSHLNIEDPNPDREYQNIIEKKGKFLKALGIVLMAPIAIGNQLVGLIGLGPEFTGGRYGHDDYDLLIALGSQTATALMAVRTAEKLAGARERQAWDRLSAFVLHDVKNAAAMLSLVQANAPAHIHNPEFQTEMLEAVDDALSRMNKVQQRINSLKAEITPIWSAVQLQAFLENACTRISKNLKSMSIDLDCPTDVIIRSDPELLFRILENLLLNAFEAGGDPPLVKIGVEIDYTTRHALVSVTDNGPGIAESLLPNALFEPLKTDKVSGSGIGLWQAKQLAASLNCTLHAENVEHAGARFEVRIPV